MKKLTYNLLIDEIHHANNVPKETLETLPVSTIIDIYHNLFGTNGVYPQTFYVNEQEQWNYERGKRR